MSPPSKPLRILLYVAATLVGLFVLAAIAVAVLVDGNTLKPRVEQAASDAFRMQVMIDGPMKVGIFGGAHIDAENVHIRNRDTELTFLKEVQLNFHLLPLLRGEIRYGAIITKGARIYIERDKDGVYNYFRPPPPGGTKPVDLPKVTFADMTFVYADKKTGSEIESSPCEGVLHDMKHPGGAPLLKRLSVNGDFSCKEIHNKTKSASDLKFTVAATDGVFDFKPLTMQAYGGQGTGTVHMDRSGEVPTLEVQYKLAKFHVEQYFKPKKSGRAVSGLMDFSTTLTMRGRTRDDLRSSATGEMTLSGNGLTLHGMDLDKELPKFASSQDFNLVDLGALLIAGPVGLVATKGYEFTTLAQPPSGTTPIRTVLSTWKVEKGVAYAKDVALSTPENRLALKGGLDFVHNEYQDVVIALVDEQGCEKVRQKISGPFNKPVPDKTSLLIPVGPILKLIDKARTLVNQKTTCEPFYTGSLPAPKAAEKVAGAIH
ncbi:MAG: AsmA family protein [Betaproteobacteria bacterium]